MNSMQIQCFLKAAQNLNFTQSAAEMFISQPAFSHNISTLEKEWGIELFVRNKKRKDTQLTPAGAIMYDGLKNMRDQFENLLQKAQSVHQGKSGTLRVGLISADRIDERTLALFDRFQEKYPSVDLLLRRGSHNELIQWLHNKTIDLSFSLKIDVTDKDWLDYQTLYSIESVLILNADHPLAQRKGLSLADFRDEVFVNVSAGESPVLNAMLKQECEKAGFTPRVLEAPDINTQTLYLESGRGVAIGSVNNTAAFNPRMTMVRLKELRSLELAAAWNRNNDNPCIPLFTSVYELIN
ncbi:MAG: LysR family transcriptional regulator [Clostridiales bacterium]|nr:LysR family transcriptional regulator [Clostridiales bacterium]